MDFPIKDLKLFSYLKKVDWTMFICIALLMTFGLLTMSSLEPGDGVFIRQIVIICISLAAFIFFSVLDYRVLKSTNILIILYGIIVILLALIFVIGYVSKGGNRWFNLGAFYIGPSEPMKLILILILAKFFSKRHIAIASFKNILLSLIYLAIPASLVMLQPDLSTAIVLSIIWFGMLIVSGLSAKHIFWFVGIALTLGIVAWSFYLAPYQKNRIINFVNPAQDIKGTGWNAYQSIVAVGSGGLVGKGIGYGTQSRLGFLPEHETDFIFASFLEEWGMVGGILVFIIFCIIIINLTRRGTKGDSTFEGLFTVGVCIWLVAQFCLNVGMNIGVLPVTGIPLPFMSHGGSHLLIESIAVGMVIGMSRYGRVAHPSRFTYEFLGLE